MFSISGDLNRPGVYEVENGVTVRELIELAEAETAQPQGEIEHAAIQCEQQRRVEPPGRKATRT